MKRWLYLFYCLTFVLSLGIVQAQTVSANSLPPTAGMLRNVLPTEGNKAIQLTDGNISTSVGFSSSTTSPAMSYAKWKFDQPKNITGYYLNAQNDYMKVWFLDANDNVILVVNRTANASDFVPVHVENVAAVKVASSITAGYYVYEFDVSDTFVDLPPSVPGNVAAYPYDGKTYVGWTANSEPSLDLAGYNVYQDGVKVNQSLLAVPYFVSSGLTNGQSHTYEVTAVDKSGQESGRSSAVSAAARKLPTPPVAVTNGKVNEIDRDIETYTQLVNYNYAIYSFANGVKEVNLYFAGYSDNFRLNDSIGRLDVRFLVNGTQISLNTYEIRGTAASKFVLTVPAGANGIRIQDKSSSSFGTRVHEIVAVAPGPMAPTHLVAVAGDRKANLTWDANQEPNIVGYNVYMDGVKINSALVNGTAYSALGLTNGVTYSFTVTAVDSDGNESPHSNIAYATPKDSWPPDVPQRVVTTGLDGQVEVKWDANTDSDLAGYNLYQDGVKVNTALITDPIYSVTGLTNGITYVYTVTAVDTSGNESVAASPAPETPRDLTAPAAPTGLSATAGNGIVTLTWTANGETDLAGYYVWQDGVKITGTPITDNSVVVTGLTNGWSYNFAITAVDAAGNQSKRSAEVVASPSNSL